MEVQSSGQGPGKVLHRQFLPEQSIERAPQKTHLQWVTFRLSLQCPDIALQKPGKGQLCLHSERLAENNLKVQNGSKRSTSQHRDDIHSPKPLVIKKNKTRDACSW